MRKYAHARKFQVEFRGSSYLFIFPSSLDLNFGSSLDSTIQLFAQQWFYDVNKHSCCFNSGNCYYCVWLTQKLRGNISRAVVVTPQKEMFEVKKTKRCSVRQPHPSKHLPLRRCSSWSTWCASLDGLSLAMRRCRYYAYMFFDGWCLPYKSSVLDDLSPMPRVRGAWVMTRQMCETPNISR